MNAIFQRFDRSSPEALLRSLAEEFARLHQSNAESSARLTDEITSLQQDNARLSARMKAMEVMATLADRIAAGEITEFGADYIDHVRIEADQAFRDGIGFHCVEFDIKGRPFRWTGPEPEFVFPLFVDRRRPSRLTLCFDSFFVDVPIEELRCFVDGRRVDLSFERVDDAWRASAEAPVRADGGGTVVAFVVPKIGSPQDLGTDDSRLIGLCFRWFKMCSEVGTAA